MSARLVVVTGRRLVVDRLDRARVDEAFPLVRLALPGLDLAAWRRQAASYGGGRDRGIFVAHDEWRRFLGLAAFALDDAEPGGRALGVDPFAAADLLDHRTVADALLGALECAALRRGCASVRIALGASLGTLGAELAAAGYRRDGGSMRRTLTSI